MRAKSLALILTLAASVTTIADDDSLLLQTRVRYRAAGDQQPVRRRAVASRPERFQTGDTVRISVADRAKPFDVAGGSVRIRSASTGYDSGEQPLVHERDGRSIYFQWRTSSLEPASDYRVETTVRRRSGAAETRQTVVVLYPVIVEQTILDRTTDLALPYWSLGLHVTRQYRFESTYGIYQGSLGYGWSHAYAPVLSEETDRSLSLYDTSTSGAGYYRPNGPGTYESAPGDDSRLTRDPDGTFHLRLANGNLWRFRNDLKPAFLQDARGHRVSFQYDAQGRLDAAIDASGQRIDFGYDGDGRIVSASDSTGRRVTYAYDTASNLEQVRGVAGDVTRYRYDARHRLTEIFFADGRTRSFEYGDYGRLSRITESGGAGGASFVYDTANPTHGERTIADAMGRVVRELSRGDGFLTESRDAIGNTTRREYDAGYRMRRFVDGKENSWHFASDVDAGREETTSPLGHKTILTYLPDDRRITSATDGNGRETRFAYGPGTLEVTTFPDGATERLQVTPQSSSASVELVRRNGRINRYVLDGRGLLLQKMLYDGSTSTYGYDARGNLTRATNATGTITMLYDVRGRMTRATYPGQRAFRYEYDDRSRVTKVTGPDGDATAYAYDSAGRAEIITRGADVVARYEYNPAMQVTRRTLGNGIATELAYDAAGRLTSITHRKGETLSAWTCTLDANGRCETRTGVDGTETFVYDGSGQLSSARYADGSGEAFEYDAGGNRTAITTTARSAVSTNALNQYVSAGSDALSWDMNGTLGTWSDAGGTTRYSWDAEDRLIRVRLPDGSTIAYTYDALGRLRSRTDGSGTRLFLWDRMQIAIEEDPAHATLRSFVWGRGLDELLEMRAGGQRYFYLGDALGSVTEVTDAQGAVTDRHRYRAFGAPVAAAGAHSPFRFTGALYDPGTGLLYLRNRWYSPVLGRFIQMDPIGIAGGINLYAYVLNDPVNETDPLGLCGGRGGPGPGGPGRPLTPRELRTLAEKLHQGGKDHPPWHGENQPWWNLP